MSNLGFNSLLAALPSLVVLAHQGVEHEAKESIFSTEYSCEPRPGGLLTKDLEVLGFVIGSSTIRDVQKRFLGTDPVRLTDGEEADKGICLKNSEGMAVIFVTGVMGAPDTIVAIYLAPAGLVESSWLKCKSVQLPSKIFATSSGIRVGAAAAEVAKTVRWKLPSDGQFCAAYRIVSSQGPLQISKGETAKKDDFTDFTGAEGRTRNGKLEWVKLFGIASN